VLRKFVGQSRKSRVVRGPGDSQDYSDPKDATGGPGNQGDSAATPNRGAAKEAQTAAPAIPLSWAEISKKKCFNR